MKLETRAREGACEGTAAEEQPCRSGGAEVEGSDGATAADDPGNCDEKDAPKDASEGASRSYFMGFDEACSALSEVGLPYIPAAFRGPLAEALSWAHSHSRDNALAHYNPFDLPLIEGNAGEGFVVRAVCEHARSHRPLAKMKNPDFDEVVLGPSAMAVCLAQTLAARSGGRAASEQAEVLASRFLLPARVAAVASKEAEADATLRNHKALAALVITDALGEDDDLWEPDERELVAPGGSGRGAFQRAAERVTIAWLKERHAAHATGSAGGAASS